MLARQSPTWLADALARLPSAQVAVFGDFCVDAYWIVSPDDRERSVETGLPVRKVRTARYSLGGAGNVAANLISLGAHVHAVGLVGPDIFGEWMLRELASQGVHIEGMLRNQPDWQTMVYAKPYIADEELNRFDFGAFNLLADASADALLQQLDRAARLCPVVILNQQVPAGVSSPALIERLNDLIARHKNTRFLVDARHRAALYRGAALKLNAHEASRLAGESLPLDEPISAAQVRAYAAKLTADTRCPVFITRGENGLVAAAASDLHEIPGIHIVDPVDPVGAGDTVAAALAALLATGATPLTAALVANSAASVTVRKLHTTGTATPAEILAVGPTPDYVYLPELAADPRHARRLDHSEIEIVAPVENPQPIRHAVFDHDGTISTLRQGWELIMEPMMVRAILGNKFTDADPSLYHKATAAVRHFIDQTTGIQTLVQMQGLVALVRRFACVPPEEIRDAAGYKQLYNTQLLALVSERVRKLQRGELDPADFQIKGAPQFLQALHARGVQLYLASGTDEADVIAEAQALGYVKLFQGRIFGAVGDVKVEAKKIVLERIMRNFHLAGPELATFGDGPVEMQETRKRGGLCVGLASDEVRRHGLNLSKRTRLIRAGAQLIIPDFSQAPALLPLLHLPSAPQN